MTNWCAACFGLASLGVADPSQRASDAERDEVVADLRQHLVDGRLTLEEFTDRVGRVLTGRTHGELAEVVADLPVTRPSAPAVNRRSDSPVPPSVTLSGGAGSVYPGARSLSRGSPTSTLTSARRPSKVRRLSSR